MTPARVVWALNVLDVQSGDRVLEFGCGPGVALAEVSARLDSGLAVGVDRSATAVARARQRSSARVIQSDLAALELAESFDKVFGINVNLFWTRSAARELEVIRGLLAPGGQLYLFFETPQPSRAGEIRRRAADELAASGFVTRSLKHAIFAGLVAKPQVVPATMGVSGEK